MPGGAGALLMMAPKARRRPGETVTIPTYKQPGGGRGEEGAEVRRGRGWKGAGGAERGSEGSIMV